MYFATLAPTVTGEDSGELITAAYFFGVPHPPGYPLWTILCGLWIHLLPFGSVAWRANSFSAACSMCAVGILIALLCRMRFRPIIAACAATAAGLSATVWSQSVITEVYALHLLLVSLLCYCVWRWWTQQQDRWLVIAAFVFGLAMANHHLIGFAALALAVWGILQRPRIICQGQLICQCLLALAIGMTPYWYMLWAGGRDVPVKWGETATVEAAWEHISRGQYKTDDPIEFVPPKTVALLVGRLYYALRWVTHDFTPFLLPILIAGFVWLLRRRSKRPILILVLLLGISIGPVFLWIGGPKLDRQDQFVQKVFLTPLALVLSIPLAAGLQWLTVALRTWTTRHQSRWMTLLTSGSVFVLLLVKHGSENNMHQYWYAHDHAQSMLACMQPNAMIFPSGDHNTFPLIYLIHVEGIRPDVTVADKYGYIDPALYREMPNNPGKPRSPEQRDQIERWIIQNSHRPIYYTVKKPSLIEGTVIEPMGLVYGLSQVKPASDAEIWSKIHYRNLEGVPAPIDYAAVNILADYHYARATHAMQEGHIEQGVEEFRKSANFAWGITEIFNNIGSALAEYGQIDAGIGYYESAAKMDWTYAPARWNLAKIFKASGRFEWSAKVFEDLAKAAPKDFRPFGELGFLYRDQFASPDRAKEWWYESLRLNPRQPQIIEALYELNHQPPKVEPVPTNNQPGESNALPTTLPTSQSVNTLQFEASEVNLGQVIRGKTVSRRVRLANKGTQDLNSLTVEGSCTCVSATGLPTTLKAGEGVEIEIKYSVGDRLGVHRESLTARSSEKEHHASLSIHAIVTPPLIARPSELTWEVFPGEVPAPISVSLRHQEGVKFSIDTVKVDSNIIKASFDDKPNTTHPIIVSFASAPTRDATLDLKIKTSATDEPTITIPVAIKVRPLFRAIPALVYFGSIARNQITERQIQIECQRKGNDTPIIKPPEQAGLSAEIKKTQDANVFQLAVTLDASKARAGPFMQMLRVLSNGSDKVLEVPIHGVVADD